MERQGAWPDLKWGGPRRTPQKAVEPGLNQERREWVQTAEVFQAERTAYAKVLTSEGFCCV